MTISTTIRQYAAKLAGSKTDLAFHLMNLADKVAQEEQQQGQQQGQKKQAKLMARQVAILQKYVDGGGRAMFYDELPPDVQAALVRVKDSEVLWSDTDRWLNDAHLKARTPKWAQNQGQKESESATQQTQQKQAYVALRGAVIKAAKTSPQARQSLLPVLRLIQRLG